MGIVDAFSAEDRITVTVSKFGEMMKAAVKADLMMNAVNCEVPHVFIREMMTGEKEEAPEVRVDVAIPVKMFTDVFKDADPKEEEEKDEPVRTSEESTGSDS